MAFLNRGLEIVFHDERPDKEQQVTFQYKGGVTDFVRHLNASKEALTLAAVIRDTPPQPRLDSCHGTSVDVSPYGGHVGEEPDRLTRQVRSDSHLL